MIRRLSDLLRGGHYEHKESWNNKHECRFPKEGLIFSPKIGDLWQCKCGKRFICKPSRVTIGSYKDWEEVTDDT